MIAGGSERGVTAPDSPGQGGEWLTGRSGWYPRYGKRGLDFILALVALIVLAPALVLVAAISRCIDGPPVLFRQARVGRQGRLFRIVKLRTMRQRPEGDSTITVKGDQRITRWGHFLRRWKLDELPQLINVIRGEMSFVGPRPDVPGYLDRLTGEAARLKEVRPGITGPASILFANEAELLAKVKDPGDFNDQVLFPAKVRISLRYAGEITLGGDLGWMLATGLPPALTYRRLLRNGWLDSLPKELRAALASCYGEK